ncbi:hypothetical protein Pmani_029184 [Petrolisthes manimaculis]|uniref:Uncharacterized protein n=1 Tax=Petrolisthes manimaculis TaxID=1843537 RepID=A0AAE1TU46_9EUCA|nr:hypothetical protein Pmani_029184 [Petrolisthes manimaculis]
MANHKCELNFLSRSDGSALYSIGSTIALASVNGPGDVKQSNRHDFRVFLDVTYNPCTGQPMIRERTTESVIRKTVEQVVLTHLYPRTAINITVQEMQSDGLALAASVNAVCMALLNASVQMKSTFAGVTCCLTPAGTIIIDPTEAEIKESSAVATFVFESLAGELIAAQEEGHLDTDTFTTCLNQCQTAAKDVFSFYRRMIANRYQEQG